MSIMPRAISKSYQDLRTREALMEVKFSYGRWNCVLEHGRVARTSLAGAASPLMKSCSSLRSMGIGTD